MFLFIDLQAGNIQEFIPRQHHFCVDLDGTLIHELRNALTILQRVQHWASPGSLSLLDQFSGDAFEGRKLLVTYPGECCFVIFRRGTRLLLRYLASKGLVYIVTHACRNYAEKFIQFLRNHCGIKLELLCIPKPTMKSVSFIPSLIIDDKPERWQSRYGVTSILPIIVETVETDDAIIKLMNYQLARSINIILHVLKIKGLYNVKTIVLGYVGSPWKLSQWIPARKCRHCRNVWVAGYEECKLCERRHSDANFQCSPKVFQMQ